MATEVQRSELQRDPKSVAALADKGDVRVRRRDRATLLQTIHEWRNTAAVHADPTLARQSTEPLADVDHGAVPNPAGV